MVKKTGAKTKISPEHEETVKNNADLLKAMGNPVRLCILEKLMQNETCTVSYFMSCMRASQSTISQHLGKLRAQNLVAVKKEGTNAYYYIKDPKAIRIMKLILEANTEEGENE